MKIFRILIVLALCSSLGFTMGQKGGCGEMGKVSEDAAPQEATASTADLQSQKSVQDHAQMTKALMQSSVDQVQQPGKKKELLEEYANLYITNAVKARNPEDILCGLYSKKIEGELTAETKKAYQKQCAAKKKGAKQKEAAVMFFAPSAIAVEGKQVIKHRELENAAPAVLNYMFDDAVTELDVPQPAPSPPPPAPVPQQGSPAEGRASEGMLDQSIAQLPETTAPESQMDKLTADVRPQAKFEFVHPDIIVELDLPADHPKLPSSTTPAPYLYTLDHVAGKTQPYLSFTGGSSKEEHYVRINRNHPDLTPGQLDGSEDVDVTILITGLVNGLQAGKAKIEQTIRLQPQRQMSLQDTPTPDVHIGVPFAWRDHEDIAGVIPDSTPKEYDFEMLPKLHPQTVYDTSQSKYVYDATTDIFQHPRPLFYKQQPDFNAPQTSQGQQEIDQHFDGCNVLTIDRAIAKFDYADEATTVGNSADNCQEWGDGTSSNFYYIVIPCQPDLMALNYDHLYLDYSTVPDETLYVDIMQPLLHIIQGELDVANDDDWYNPGIYSGTFLDLYPGRTFHRPSHRIQSFMPSLFAGQTLNEPLITQYAPPGTDSNYTKREWIDTNTQAPLQDVEYRNLAIWDWDMPIDASSSELQDCVLVVFIEGDDGEEHYSQLFSSLPHPTDLTDDLIAMFLVYRNNTTSGPFARSNNRHKPAAQPLIHNTNWDFQAYFSTTSLPTCQQP